jgi:hypothetical protein
LAIVVRRLAIGEAHFESLFHRAAAKTSLDVEYSNLKVIPGCKAEGKSN